MRAEIKRLKALIETLRANTREWAEECTMLRAALVAVDSEIILDGQIKEIVDKALHPADDPPEQTGKK